MKLVGWSLKKKETSIPSIDFIKFGMSASVSLVRDSYLLPVQLISRLEYSRLKECLYIPFHIAYICVCASACGCSDFYNRFAA